MKNQEKMKQYQNLFNKENTVDQTLEEKKALGLNMKISAYNDFPRIMFGPLSKNIFINDQPIMVDPRYINDFKSHFKTPIAKTPEEAEEAIEKNFQFVQNMLKKILQQNGIPAEKLDPTVLDSFMSGFHQSGYALALQKTLKEIIPDPKDPTRFKPLMNARFDIKYEKDNPQAIRLKETVDIVMIADLHKPEQMDAASAYEKASPEQKNKYKPIAIAKATYEFSKDKIPKITKDKIKLYPKNDEYNMLHRIPDDRTLSEKFKDFIANMFSSTKRERTQQMEIQPEPITRPRR